MKDIIYNVIIYLDDRHYSRGDKSMKEKRNGIISLWKFLFAIVIAFFHCSQFYQDIKNPFFPGGYIAVEFFFIVSGFYLAKKGLKE